LEHSISGRQALKAHRALEKLEGKTKSAGTGPVRLELLLPRALEEDRTEESPQERDWCEGVESGRPWLGGLGKA